MTETYICQNIDSCPDAGKDCKEIYDSDIGIMLDHDCACGHVRFFRSAHADRIECDKKVHRMGTSLTIAITKELRNMGLGEGDIVHVTIDKRNIHDTGTSEPAFDQHL